MSYFFKVLIMYYIGIWYLGSGKGLVGGGYN